MILFYIYVALWMFFMLDEAWSLISEFMQRDAKTEGNFLVRVAKTVWAHFTDDVYNVLDCLSYLFSGQTIWAWIQFDNDPFRRLFYFEEMPEWKPAKCNTQPIGYKEVCSDA